MTVNLRVPTVWCNVLLTQTIIVSNQRFGAGELVRVPYGVALQGIATNVFTIIKDADEIHRQASEALVKFGGDSWFPPKMQTISRVEDYLNAVDAAEERAKCKPSSNLSANTPASSEPDPTQPNMASLSSLPQPTKSSTASPS